MKISRGYSLRFVYGLSCMLILLFNQLNGQDLESVGKEKFVDWSGGIAVTTTYYDAVGIENRRDPFFWQATANLNLSFLGGIVQAPFSFVISQQNKNFSQPQPFNRFGLSPTYRSWKVHLGHRSLNFSDYTLAGNIFFGLGVEYESEKTPWRASAMYGRLARAVDRSASSGVTFVEPSFQRRGYGTKVGYSRNRQSIDFIFFRAFDDPSSLSNTDSLSITPEENVVLGLVSKLRLLKKITFDLDYAYSLYSRDRNSPEVLIEEYTFVNNLGGLFTPTVSSNYTTAVTTGFTYSGRGFQLNAKYRRVDPEFTTLGSAFLNNDLEDISGGGSVSLFNSRVTLSSNAGVQRNNLDDQLTANNRRFIFSSSANWLISQRLQMAASYGNFNTSTRQTQLQADVLVDSLEFFQVSRNGSVNLNYNIGKVDPYVVMLSGTIQDASDNSGNSSTFMSYNAGIQKKIAKVWNLSFAATANHNQTQLSENLTTGPSITASRSFNQGKYRTSLATSLLNVYNQGELDSSVTNFRLNGSVRAGERHSISVSSFYIIRTSQTELDASVIKEFRGTVNYNFRI